MLGLQPCHNAFGTDEHPKPAKSSHPSSRMADVAIATSLLLGVSLPAEDSSTNASADFMESLRDAGRNTRAGGRDRRRRRHRLGAGVRPQDLSSVSPRTDTPFHLDGVTQLFTAAMVLRCVEEARLSLDDRAGDSGRQPDANATLGQLLSHSETPGGLVFAYRPERLEPLSPALRFCNTGRSARRFVVFEQFGMLTRCQDRTRPPHAARRGNSHSGSRAALSTNPGTPRHTIRLGLAGTRVAVAL